MANASEIGLVGKFIVSDTSTRKEGKSQTGNSGSTLRN